MLVETTRRASQGFAIQIMTAIAIVLIIAAQAWALWRSYQATWLLETRSAENTVNSIAANIERNLNVIELSLLGLVDAATDAAVLALPPDLRNRVLFDSSASARYLGSMLVLDVDGNIKFDSGAFPPRVANLRDRDYFQAQMKPRMGTFVSLPFESRIRNGDVSIAISRQLANPDGDFDGVAVATLRVAYFKTLFEGLSLAPGSIISLIRSDGTLIYRHPSTDGRGNVGFDLRGSNAFRRIKEHPNIPFQERSVIDLVNRYYVHTQIASYPLVLSIGISTSEAMRSWYRQLAISIAVILGTIVLIAVIIRSLRLALARSVEIEDELERLSLTDALTDLPNRRAFDLALQTEVRRSARSGTRLSLALLDIDHFKRVNDQHGHPVGDEVLHRLARVLLGSVRRPGDYVARHGGEEFVVLLPDTEPDGARHIAETIRRNAEAMAPSLNDADLQQITVSIGVATHGFRPGDRPEDLVRQADQALYEAKGMGRNRIVVHGDRVEDPSTLELH